MGMMNGVDYVPRSGQSQSKFQTDPLPKVQPPELREMRVAAHHLWERTNTLWESYKVQRVNQVSHIHPFCPYMIIGTRKFHHLDAR